MIKLDVTKINKVVPEIECIDGPEGMFAYMFIEGPYTGISYTYTNLSITEQKDGFLNVKFGVDVLTNFKNVKYDEKEFYDKASEILEKIMNAAIEAGNVSE